MAKISGNLLWEKAMSLSQELHRLTELRDDEPLPHRKVNLQDSIDACDVAFNESGWRTLRAHMIVEGTVVLVLHDEAYVDIGYKQEIAIPKRELAYPEPDSAEDIVKVGDRIKVYIQSLGGYNGGVLSKIKADAEVVWEALKAVKAHNDDPNVEELYTVDATIGIVVKGGLTAGVCGLRGFIPASQVALHFVKDLSLYVGQTVEVVPLEIAPFKRRLVLSRRAIFEGKRIEIAPEVAEQLRKASIAIPAKITEGARLRTPEKIIAFLEAARTSTIELETQLQLWTRLKYFPEYQIETALNLCRTVSEMLAMQAEELQQPKADFHLSK